MTVKISGTPFDQIVPEIQEALDAALARTLFEQQGSLNKQPNIDTGRMASSWQIGYNASASPADRGEGWTGGVQTWEYTGKITFKGNWYISNNVPYAQPICYLGGYPASWDYKPVEAIPKDWFTKIANQTGNVFVKNWNKVKP